MAFLRRALVMILAVLFLIEAWIWDAFAALGHWLARVLHLARLTEALRGVIGRLPPWVSLALFIIPVSVLFPFKLLALWLLAKGHLIWGGLTFFVAKTTSVGVSAILFDLSREQLLTMPWFARLYRVLMAFRLWAHNITAPLRAQIAAWRQALWAMVGKGRLGRLIRALRARIRRRAVH